MYKNLEQFIKGIDVVKNKGYYEGNSYIVNLEDDEAFGRVYTKLETLKEEDKLQEYEVGSKISVELVDFLYGYQDKYTVELIGDLEHDIYKVIFSEAE